MKLNQTNGLYFSVSVPINDNLDFAGEVLDVDAMTGGFNLQIAWSTGYLAGECT